MYQNESEHERGDGKKELFSKEYEANGNSYR